jgi:hypothetical protein
MVENIFTASQLKDFSNSNKSSSSGGQDITKILKEANGFINNLKGLFTMGEQFRQTREGDTPQGNAGAKYEKGIEAGKKSINVDLIVDGEGALTKFEPFLFQLLGDNDKLTIADAKAEITKQFNGENRPLIKTMIEDFIRSYATARAI